MARTTPTASSQRRQRKQAFHPQLRASAITDLVLTLPTRTILLSWDTPDDDSITGYQILRRQPSEGEHALSVYVADTGSTGTSFTDTDVTTETLHVYRVKAINAAGVKPGSNYVRVKPSAANPTTTLSRHKRLGPPDAGRPKA